MSTNRMLAIGLLALGAILLYFGLNAADSPAEKIGEAVTGSYSDNTMMYLIGGGVSAVVGLFMLMKKS